MFQRAALLMAVASAACAASPLAAAEAVPDSTSAGLRGLASADHQAVTATPARPAPLAVPSDQPRRYSLHRDYGEQPDPTVLPPEFFLQSAPVGADPTADAPRRDRSGRLDEAPATPDSPSA